jgi:uncharacterized protein
MNGIGRFYVDPSIIIPLVEGEPTLKKTLLMSIRAVAGTQSPQFVASPLTMLECLIKPLRQRDMWLEKLYRNFFASLNVIIVPIDDLCWQRATLIRAHYGFAVPDALHLAIAQSYLCDGVLTRDARWQRFPDIRIELL